MERAPPADDRYTLLRKIGAGGMAEVFLARQRGAAGFEKLVVLKRIHPAQSGRAAARAGRLLWPGGCFPRRAGAPARLFFRGGPLGGASPPAKTLPPPGAAGPSPRAPPGRVSRPHRAPPTRPRRNSSRSSSRAS